MDWTQGERVLLADTFLFRGAEGALEAALTDPRCTRAQAERGEVIYDPRRFRRCLAVLLSGRVQVSKGELILSVLEPGELFGAAALFSGESDYATTLTARQRCGMLFLPQDLVEELMAKFPAVGRSYVAYLSQRIHFLSGKIDALIAGSAERKLAQYLLAHRQGDGAELDCSYTGLARRLGVSRASLYRAFDGLSEGGLIVREEKRVRLLRPEGLKEV